MAIKYKWLAGRLEDLIQKSISKGINRLPTEAELAARYGVSRQTVRMALGLLENSGLIVRRQGSGSYITGLSREPRSNVIALLLTSSQEYLYPGIIQDIRTALEEDGFFAEVFVTNNQVARERDILSSFLKHPPRGIIAEGVKSALPNPNLSLYRQLLKKGCQMVFLHSRYPALADCPVIKDDNYGGSALLVRHLSQLGHKALAGIFKFDDAQGVERYQGFLETAAELSLSVPDEHISWFGSDDLDRLTADNDTGFLKRIIENGLSGCTAVVCYNDMIAYHLIRELIAAGYELPSDMAVAAFDNTYLSNSDLLTVTTLSHRPHEMGRAAASAIVRKLKGLPAVSQEVRWELNQKESTREER